MNESIPAEDKKQGAPKPPLSWRRIAGEILAGTATGFVSVPVLYASAIVLFGGRGRDYTGSVGQLHLFGDLAMFIFVFPMVYGLFYGLASALGVYLVGSRGKQTGSFLATLGCGFLAGGVTLFMFPFFAFSSYLIGVEKIVLGAVVLLTAPIMATLGFNATRRYKKPASS